jgi:hypothetical protein
VSLTDEALEWRLLNDFVHRDVLAVACSVQGCGAQPGEECRPRLSAKGSIQSWVTDDNGRQSLVTTRFHQNRYYLARQRGAGIR